MPIRRDKTENRRKINVIYYQSFLVQCVCANSVIYTNSKCIRICSIHQSMYSSVYNWLK